MHAKLECPPAAIRYIEKAVGDRLRNAREFVEYRADVVLIDRARTQFPARDGKAAWDGTARR